MPNDGTGANWDETAPADSDSIANGALEVRDLRTGVGLRVAKEHEAPAGSTVGGEHLKGSARAYFQSSFPSKRPDASTDLSAGDAGRLLVRSTDGTLYYIDGTGSWVAIAIAASSQIADGIIGTSEMATSGSKASKFAIVSEKQNSGTDAGTLSSGSWRTRSLNDETFDNDEIVSVSSSQISLAAGTYRVDFWATAYACGHHQVRLRNITDSATVVYGSTEQSSTSVATKSCGSAEFTISDTKLFELQHQCETTNTGNGMGTAAGFGGVEYYSQIKIWKVG